MDRRLENLDVQRLRWAIQALAADAATQVVLFPDFVEPADELALEWEEHYRRFIRNGHSATLDEAQVAALRGLDELLSSLSGSARSGLWERQALFERDEWDAIRATARSVLTTLGWGQVTPPSRRGDVWMGPRGEVEQ